MRGVGADICPLGARERIRQRSDDGKALKYCAQFPGVMQGSQEGKRTNLWGPCAHFGANIPMKIGHNNKNNNNNNNKFIKYYHFAQVLPIEITINS